MVMFGQAGGWLLNLILPGAGLIVRRREWLGFSLALLFGICGNLALAGWLIAPAAVPSGLTFPAFVISGLIWLIAQICLLRQAAWEARCARDMSLLLRKACVALDSGEIEPARVCLESGFALDNENVGLHILWARLLALEGDVRSARKALVRVAKLDVRKQFQVETAQAMETLIPLDPRGGRSA